MKPGVSYQIVAAHGRPWWLDGSDLRAVAGLSAWVVGMVWLVLRLLPEVADGLLGVTP